MSTTANKSGHRIFPNAKESRLRIHASSSVSRSQPLTQSSTQQSTLPNGHTTSRHDSRLLDIIGDGAALVFFGQWQSKVPGGHTSISQPEGCCVAFGGAPDKFESPVNVETATPLFIKNGFGICSDGSVVQNTLLVVGQV
jgi:hypothetical protein